MVDDAETHDSYDHDVRMPTGSVSPVVLVTAIGPLHDHLQVGRVRALEEAAHDASDRVTELRAQLPRSEAAL